MHIRLPLAYSGLKHRRELDQTLSYSIALHLLRDRPERICALGEKYHRYHMFPFLPRLKDREDSSHRAVN
jgi:hypothetical protein